MRASRARLSVASSSVAALIVNASTAATRARWTEALQTQKVQTQKVEQRRRVGLGCARIAACALAPVKPVQLPALADLEHVVLPALLLALPLQRCELIDGDRAHTFAMWRLGLAGGEHESGDIEQRGDVVGGRPVRLLVADELAHVLFDKSAQPRRRKDAGEAVKHDLLLLEQPAKEAQDRLAVALHLHRVTRAIG